MSGLERLIISKIGGPMQISQTIPDDILFVVSNQTSLYQLFKNGIQKKCNIVYTKRNRLTAMRGGTVALSCCHNRTIYVTSKTRQKERQGDWIIIQERESVTSVAKRFNVKPETLRVANGRPSVITEFEKGDIVFVPYTEVTSKIELSNSLRLLLESRRKALDSKMTVSIATEDSKPNLGLRQYQSFFISFVSLLLIAGATLYLLPNQLGKTKILRIPKFFKERSKANLHRLKEAIRGNVSDSVKGDSSVWVPCTLRQRRELVTGMSRYTFDLPSPRSTLDLELGQRVIFEVEHEPGKVSRGSYLLCTERTQQGNFDVVVPSTAASAVSGLDLSGNNDPGFSDALSHLNIGDLVRVRPGAKMLYYRGPKSPVDTLSIACSGVGVAPICSLLVDILSDPESAVTSVVLLVVNDQADQFICLDELESLEKRFSHIVKLYCVWNNPTDSSTWEQTNFIEEAVSNYCPFWKEGMMALLCGSSNFIGHGLKSFRLLGYSKEVVVCL